MALTTPHHHAPAHPRLSQRLLWTTAVVVTIAWFAALLASLLIAR